MKNIFTEHPHSVGESYFQHMKFASYFGFNMMLGGLACLTHAIFPFIFQKTGSNVLIKMTHDFIERMPEVESRVLKLSQVIEKKATSSKTSTHANQNSNSNPNPKNK